jgi:hypothetical protein
MKLSKGHIPLVAVAVLGVVLSGCSPVPTPSQTRPTPFGTAAPEKSPTPPGVSLAPVAPTTALQSEAAAASAEQLKALPSDIRQVDCRPGSPTFPPYTDFTGFSAGFYILADGRCFIDPAATPLDLHLPTISTKP